MTTEKEEHPKAAINKAKYPVIMTYLYRICKNKSHKIFVAFVLYLFF